MNINVRKLRRKELHIALSLAERIFDDYDLFWFKYWLPRSTILVAESNDMPLGIAELVIRKTICGTTGVIMYLGVLEEFRRKGIGKILVIEAEKYFKSRGIRTFMASTRSWNKPSIILFTQLGYKALYIDELYNRLGYVITYNLVASLHAYEDDVIFVKSLDESCLLI